VEKANSTFSIIKRYNDLIDDGLKKYRKTISTSHSMIAVAINLFKDSHYISNFPRHGFSSKLQRLAVNINPERIVSPRSTEVGHQNYLRDLSKQRTFFVG
jgi:hypothetical protein